MEREGISVSVQTWIWRNSHLYTRANTCIYHLRRGRMCRAAAAVVVAPDAEAGAAAADVAAVPDVAVLLAAAADDVVVVFHVPGVILGNQNAAVGIRFPAGKGRMLK